ncbi:hypothetical protein COLO4_30868 [Corchorus olitorius]|uniref:Uncharacterized protein n=1 Tax=Corchorus olitorius TaxID=93759 RepID=A0A1R3H6M1_9ROSI|nr:hypothetical protein COLO4_30868 [Corchorus olitorius]
MALPEVEGMVAKVGKVIMMAVLLKVAFHMEMLICLVNLVVVVEMIVLLAQLLVVE